MQTDQPNSPHLDFFRSVNCQYHPEEQVQFLCISSDICSKNNLLCTECIDSSGKDHCHQLVSVRKFHGLIRTYTSRSVSYTGKARQAIQNLRKEINEQMDNLENFSLEQFNLKLNDQISSEIALRDKLKSLVSKPIWSRLHQKIQKQEELEESIGSEINLYWEPATNTIKEILNMAKESCEKLESEYTTLKDDNSDELRSGVGKFRKREAILKEIPLGDEVESDSEDIELDDNEEYENNEKKNKKKNKKINSKVKRYTKNQKLNILREIKGFQIQMNTTHCKRMLAKRYKIATSTLIRWEKWYDQEYGNKNEMELKQKKKDIEEIKIEDSV